MASRCETVLNTTMAEMETYHAQKIEDVTSIAKDHLDGEIEFYEQVGAICSLVLLECEQEPPGVESTPSSSSKL